MNFRIIFGVVGILLPLTSVAIQPGNVPAVAGLSAVPPQTLAQELKELHRIIPTKQLNLLITRYLLNDAEFQSIIRAINSQEAFFVRLRFMSQPEVVAFRSWLRSQLLQSSDSLELLDSEELIIFNKSPYWANSVYGWQGFVNEFQAYFQQEVIKAHIANKVSQNGVFAQYWSRLQGLKLAYERVLVFPETQRVIAKLQTLGVNTNQIDQFIRNQFDWTNVRAVNTIPSNNQVMGVRTL